MRIVLFAQAAFGEEVLKRLLARGEEVVGLYTPPDPQGGKNPLKELAQGAGIPVFQPKTMKDKEVVADFKRLAPDLNLLAFVTNIIPGEILRFPTHGSIQYHPSLLPKHRGRSAINWAVIKGETKTGLTIFWVDEGIDTGPIILQKEVEISEEDTTGSLYFDKLFPMGVDALMEALDLVKQGKAPRIPQDESQATYEPPCDENQARIDWSRPQRVVYDLIRGCDPQPGAWSSLKGLKVQFYSAKRLDEAPGRRKAEPGEVLGVGDDGVAIATSDGALLVGRLRPQGGSKLDAALFARQLGLKEGDKFE